MIVTLPLRAEPTQFSPFGSLILINYLRKHGINDVEFYDTDVHRPTFEVVMEHIRKAKPGILGISAVVSTAYAYTLWGGKEPPFTYKSLRKVVDGFGSLRSDAEALELLRKGQ